MYLSKFLLDPASRQVQSEIANRYELHRTLTAQFPQNSRASIGLLYRIELPVQQTYQPISMLVQTQIKPDWKVIVQSGLLIEPPLVKSFDPVFGDGKIFFFRLLGNPTVRRKQPGGKSKRVGLYTDDEQMDWINRKAFLGGFDIQSLKIQDLGIVESIKRKNKHTHIIKHQAVQFEGLLRVKDPKRFSNAIINGIGSAKAFGFGLLSLA